MSPLLRLSQKSELSAPAAVAYAMARPLQYRAATACRRSFSEGGGLGEVGTQARYQATSKFRFKAIACHGASAPLGLKTEMNRSDIGLSSMTKQKGSRSEKTSRLCNGVKNGEHRWSSI